MSMLHDADCRPEPPKPMSDSDSSHDDDDVFFFQSQTGGLVFASDEDEATSQGAAGTSAAALHEERQDPCRGPGAPVNSRPPLAETLGSRPLDPAAAPFNNLAVGPNGSAVLALSPEALAVGFQRPSLPSSSQSGRDAASAEGREVSYSGQGVGATFPHFQVRDAGSVGDGTLSFAQTSCLQECSYTTSSNASPTAAAAPLHRGNIYAGMMQPPLNAVALDFRSFYLDDDETASMARKLSPEELLELESIPDAIKREESAGIFMGQLPSSYTETDIKLLLKALARMSPLPLESDPEAGDDAWRRAAHSEDGRRKRYVQIRDVKCHTRDKTCAFIMINASSLAAILDFSKRVLCDVSCAYVCDADKKRDINNFIAKFPRGTLKGVPKAALVLEKLTPQGRHNNPAGNQGANGAGNGGRARALQPAARDSLVGVEVGDAVLNGIGSQGYNSMAGLRTLPGGYATSPLGGRMPNPSAPAFVPSSLLGANAAALGAQALMSPMHISPQQQLFLQQQQQQQQAGLGQPSSMAMMSVGVLGGQPGGGQFVPGQLRAGSTPFVSVNAGSGVQFPNYLGSSLNGARPIATMEAANQALIAASRSRQNSLASNDANVLAANAVRSSPSPSTQQSTSVGGDGRSSPSYGGSACAAGKEERGNASSSPNNTRVQPVSLTPTLEGFKCSCGNDLQLSQVVDNDEPNHCEMCKREIDRNMVICYCCSQGHLYVCSLCGLKHIQRKKEKSEKEAQQPAKPKFTLVPVQEDDM